MAINFTVGEFVVINRAYVEKILGTTDCGCNVQTLSSLGYIGANPSEVLAVGSVFVNATAKSFIQVRPRNSKNPAYNNNKGIVVYFCSDAHLNNSIELSTAFIDDKCFVKAQNISGGIITKGALVYQAGFDGTLQLPNIDLAAATAPATCAVLGLATADIAIGECGSILIEGSFGGLDTSTFATIGQTVFLSDTAGAISATAGSTEKVVARISTISATDGSIILDSVTAGSGGGGFFTDGVGTDAAIGKGVVAPTAAGANSLAQGNSSSASARDSFALGDTNTIPSNAYSSFSQGKTNSINGQYTFVQGENQITSGVGYTNMLQGYNNTAAYTYRTFSQGQSNYVQGASGNYSYQNFQQGLNLNTLYSDDTFSQGQANDINSGSHSSLAQGRSNIVNTPYSFVQGRGNTIPPSPGRCNFVSGYNNTITGTSYAYQSAIFGYAHTVDDPYNSLVFGAGSDFTNCYGTLGGGWYNYITTRSDYSIFVGNGNDAERVTNSLVVGGDHTLIGDCYNITAIGVNQNLNGNYSSTSMGYSNTTGVGSRQTFIQGTDNVVSGGVRLVHSGGITGTFSVGQTITGSTSGATGVIVNATFSSSTWVRKLTGTFIVETITTGSGSAVVTSILSDDMGENIFAQGDTNIVASSRSFAHGQNNTISIASQNSAAFGYGNTVEYGTGNALVVGDGNTISNTNAFALGRDNVAGDYNTVAIGRGTTTHSLNNFAFGSLCRAGYGDTPGNVAFGGYYTYADGYNSQAFGYYSQIDTDAAYSTILGGFTTTIEAENCLAHGKTAGADITGQRAFSAQTSSGGSNVGPYPKGPADAQWSFVAHEAVISGASPSVNIDIPTDTGRAYSFQINMVMNDTGSTNRGSFVISQMLAHNAAGTATLVGTPAFTAITDGADIANFTTAVTTSGANVRFTFTRNAATLVYRIAYYISFIEKD